MPVNVVRDLIPTEFSGLGIDVFVLPATNRRKRLLVADMDSTLITIECVDELADLIGKKSEVAAITELAMAGVLDFESALRQRVSLLEGVPETAADQVISERLRLMPGAIELAATMRAHGARTAVVSGGFTLFTTHVARMLGLDFQSANRLEIIDGRLTGRLSGPIIGPRAKLETLEELTTRYDLSPGDTLAVGDGANDRDMIAAAGLGVAYRARPVVEAVADVAVRHGDLRTLLYIQGYADDEIVETVSPGHS